MRLFVTYLIGLTFGIGISISGMANPAKVLNFFDIAGTWDPSLAFVMGGAVTVAAIGYRLVFARTKPIMSGSFQVPTARHLDRRLIGGSAVFGIGWGIAGFCPGGAIPAIGTGRAEVLLFIAALIGGIYTARALMHVTAPTPHKSPVRH